MCGLFGAVVVEPTLQDFYNLRSLFLKLESRGHHASGVAWVKDRMVHIHHEGIPAHEFVKGGTFSIQFMLDMVNEDRNLYILGHTRWTTSSPTDHQPLGDEEFALVHNGIVTGEPAEKWESLYGIKTDGGNDSELIWQTRVHSMVHPVHRFSTSSIAVCELYANKTLIAYRNHARPLAMYNDGRVTVFASTEEALKESGYDDEYNWGMVESYRDYIRTADKEKNVTKLHTKKYQRFFPDMTVAALGDK